MLDNTSLIDAMTELDDRRVMECVRAMIEGNCSLEAIQMGLNIGISNVGKRFESGEYFIADLIVSSMIYRDALNIMMPLRKRENGMPIGRVVIGVATGDIHDIGKDIIVSLLRVEHFEVIDLGIDVKPDRFAYALRTYRPDVLLISGVMTFAQESMKKTIKLLEIENLRSEVPILIGGSCASEYVMKMVGADAWAYDTKETINFCKQVVREKYGKGR